MGWANGASLLQEIVSVLEANVTDFQSRIDIYKELITIFEDYDADTLDEVYQTGDDAFDKAWAELNPVKEYGDDERYEDEDD